MKLVNAKKMTEIDYNSTNDFGIPSIVLMENAGIRLWDQFCQDFCIDDPPSTLNLVFFCGSGNNGGDGLVMARQAWNQGHFNISIIVSKDPESGHFSESCQANLNICLALGIPYFIFGQGPYDICLAEADIIFDCLCGTGIVGSLKDTYEEMVEEINDSSAQVVAVDVPSGLGDLFKRGFPVVEADYCYTLGLPKESLFKPAARPICGTIEIVKIGFPAVLTDDKEILAELGQWDEAAYSASQIADVAYKNSRGHVGVFAGALGTLGAALLSAQGAGRSRAGLVTLNVDNELYGAAAAATQGIMVVPLEEDIDTSRFNSLLVGPGWGQNGRSKLLSDLMASGLPGVLDADGLRLWFESGCQIPRVPWIFTPHPGEMALLTGASKQDLLDDPQPHGLELARKSGSVICFKSHVLWIFAPDGRIKVVDGMNAALGTGGTGDILGGIMAGLLANGLDNFDAAWIGASLHQEAGLRCRKLKGWFLAEDLLPFISQISEELGTHFE